MPVTTPALAPPMNHVFVDFENVHQVDLSLIGAKSVSFILMVGAKQTKLDSHLVEKLMAHSLSVQLVKLKSSGNNALDFALAYYLGRAALADPTAYFHIVSKDGGFDPLIEHLRARHIQVHRHVSCAELPFSWPEKKPPVSEPSVVKTVAKKAVAKKVAQKTVAKIVAEKAEDKMDPVETWVERVLKDFKDHPNAQPKKRKALSAKVGNLIMKAADGPEASGDCSNGRGREAEILREGCSRISPVVAEEWFVQAEWGHSCPHIPRLQRLKKRQESFLNCQYWARRPQPLGSVFFLCDPLRTSRLCGELFAEAPEELRLEVTATLLTSPARR